MFFTVNYLSLVSRPQLVRNSLKGWVFWPESAGLLILNLRFSSHKICRAFGSSAAATHRLTAVPSVHVSPDYVHDPQFPSGHCFISRLLFSIVVQEVKRRRGNEGYNVATNEYEDLIKAGVVDPKKVTRSALQNAASIAALLLTTECLITEMQEKPEMANG
jgi:hypothetical protein